MSNPLFQSRPQLSRLDVFWRTTVFALASKRRCGTTRHRVVVFQLLLGATDGWHFRILGTLRSKGLPNHAHVEVAYEGQFPLPDGVTQRLLSGNRLPVLSLPLLGPSQQTKRPFLSILKFLSEQHLLVGA